MCNILPKRKILFCLVTLLVSISVYSQSHWESIIYANDEWSYINANSSLETNWFEPAYNYSSWEKNIGSFGYGDADDTTELVVEYSLYLRKSFQVSSTAVIDTLLIDIDYDDAFVAYLNGVPVARSQNVDTDYPNYNYSPIFDSEARMYSGGKPYRYGISSSLLVQGENTLAIQGINMSPSSSDFSLAPFLHALFNVSDSLYKNVPNWFEYSNEVFTSNLPLIIINSNGQYIPDEPKISASMGIIATDGVNKITDSYNDYNGFIGIEKRGQTSLGFDKKSYAIETRLEDGSNNNVSLLGMPEENDWVLYGPYSDKSLIRNYLAYSVSAKTGQYAPRVKLCEVFLNEEYNGIYVLTEKIKRDKNRVDISKLNTYENEGEDLTGGYILRIDKGDDLSWKSPYKSNNGLDVDIQYYYPKPDSISSQQQKYIREFITDFENELFNADFNNTTNSYAEYIDEQSFADFFIVNELARNVDGFRLSTYFYKDKDKGGVISPLKMGPIWDFNLGFGNVDYDPSYSPQGWLYQQDFGSPHHQDPHPFWWQKLMSNPVFNNRVLNSWKEYRNTIFSDENLVYFIDSLAAELEDPSYRNFERYAILGQHVWPNKFVGGTYAEELEFLKEWILDRVVWMDNNLKVQEVGVIDISTQIALHYYPNPVINQLNISFLLEQSENITVRIVDMSGRVLFNMQTTANLGYNRINITSQQFNWQALKTGTYVMQIEKQNRQQVNKIFIKQ